MLKSQSLGASASAIAHPVWEDAIASPHKVANATLGYNLLMLGLCD